MPGDHGAQECSAPEPHYEGLRRQASGRRAGGDTTGLTQAEPSARDRQRATTGPPANAVLTAGSESPAQPGTGRGMPEGRKVSCRMGCTLQMADRASFASMRYERRELFPPSSTSGSAKPSEVGEVKEAQLSKKLAAILVSATVCAPPAFAEVTAREVVDLLLESARSAGLTVEYANERTGPNALVLEEVRLSILQDGALIAIKPEWIRFAELGDGTVAATFPDEVPISAAGDADSGAFEGTIATTGYKAIVERNSESWLLSSRAKNFAINLEEAMFSRTTEVTNLRSKMAISGTLPESGSDGDEFAPESIQFSFDSLEHTVRPLTPGATPYSTILKNSDIGISRNSPQETEFNATYSELEFKYGEIFGFGTGAVGISSRYLERSDGGDDEFNIGISLDELALRDAFLELLDRSGKIPREPGSFNAKAIMNFRGGWLDEFLSEDATWNEADSPGLKRFQMQGINASWGGASVDVAGDMRFKPAMDAEGNMTFAPAGVLDVRLDGVLALLDLLVAAGAMSAADTAGLRILIAGMGEPAADKADSYMFHMDFEPGRPLLVNGNPSPF